MNGEGVASAATRLGLEPGAFSISSFIAGSVFGLIGLLAFLRGRKAGHAPTLIISIALMVYPFFVTQPLAAWLVGLGLTGGLFFFRDV